MKLHLAAALILAATQIPAHGGDKHAAAVQAITDNEARWNREFELRDLDKMLAHYADDAVMIVPGLPASRGKDAIRSGLKDMLADPAMSLKFQISRVEVAESGDMATSLGTFTVTMTDPDTGKPGTSAGNYVTVYKKRGGEWKAVFDIASPGPATRPAPAAKEEK
jgi:uncharacterized protein (TIGR02246 family)